MPSVTVTVPHNSTPEEVTARLKRLMAKAMARNQDKVQNFVEEWSDTGLKFSFTTYGFNVGGTVAVDPTNVQVVGNLPFAAMMFKGKIEQGLKDELTKALA